MAYLQREARKTPVSCFYNLCPHDNHFPKPKGRLGERGLMPSAVTLGDHVAFLGWVSLRPPPSLPLLHFTTSPLTTGGDGWVGYGGDLLQPPIRIKRW